MNVYIDSADFSTATTVYLDDLLSEVAPDGYYSDNTNYRRQVDGKLTDIIPCPLDQCADVTIGTQIWTGCNLNVSKYRNGDSIPEVTDPTAWAALTTGAWCYYNNDSANGPIHGKLYNWYAVNDPRGLAPFGYHVPSDEEFTTLTTFLGGATVAGGKMKESGLDHWLTPNTGATNESGFTGIPGGFRQPVFGDFTSLNLNLFLWSSTEVFTNNAYNLNLIYNSNESFRRNDDKVYGFSVRLIKD